MLKYISKFRGLLLSLTLSLGLVLSPAKVVNAIPLTDPSWLSQGPVHIASVQSSGLLLAAIAEAPATTEAPPSDITADEAVAEEAEAAEKAAKKAAKLEAKKLKEEQKAAAKAAKAEAKAAKKAAKAEAKRLKEEQEAAEEAAEEEAKKLAKAAKAEAKAAEKAEKMKSTESVTETELDS